MKTMKTFTYRILSICACIMAFMLGSCVKNEFKVDFEFPKDHLGNYLLSYYAWDSRKGRWIERTTSIQEGVASIDGVTRLPTLVYVSDASQPGNSMIIYVERGDKIKISGDGKDMTSWTVVGNKFSERWSDWRKGAYGHKNDTTAFHKSIGEYVKKNPKDKLSAILLLTEWSRRKDPEGFVGLWNSIDKGARSQELVEMCGVSDLLGVEFITTADGGLEYAKDSKLKTLPLRSRDNGTDTLKFTVPSFMYIFTENNTARRETIDSIKVLVKAYPDSTKRVMADIYMDSDSTTWVNAIRRDSVKGVVRAWVPRGVVEEDMVKMGVTRLPWYIVKDKGAKEVYAGDDLAKATAAFRKLMGKPDTKATKVDKDKDKDKDKGKDKEKDKPKSDSKPARNKTPKAASVQKAQPLAKEPLNPQKTS